MMAFVDGTDCTAVSSFDRFERIIGGSISRYEISMQATATIAEAFARSVREFAEAVAKSFPWERIARAEESVRIAARLQPKQLSMGQFGGLKKFRRLARSACPARFAFYQGEFA